MLKRLLILTTLVLGASNGTANTLPLAVDNNERIVFLGNGLGERMIYYPYFEIDESGS